MRKQYSGTYVTLSIVFVSAVLVANILATMFWVAPPFGLGIPAAILVFPITYALSDVFGEVYGYQASRRIALLAYACNLGMVLLQLLGQVLVGEGVSVLWTFAPFIAGLTAYQIGDWLNDVVFAKLRGRHGTKLFWLRAIISSVIGEVIDSAIFMPILVLLTAGALGPDFGKVVLTQAGWKLAVEAVVLPLTIFLVRWIRNREGSDVYAQASRYSFFG